MNFINYILLFFGIVSFFSGNFIWALILILLGIYLRIELH